MISLGPTPVSSVSKVNCVHHRPDPGVVSCILPWAPHENWPLWSAPNGAATAANTALTSRSVRHAGAGAAPERFSSSRGLRDWCRLLQPNGHVALTEVCWRKREPPAECAEFLAPGVPGYPRHFRVAGSD